MYYIYIVESIWARLSVGCIYAPYKVNPNIFQFYFDFPDIFHHTSMHPLFHNIDEFYLIFCDFISSFIIYNNYLYSRRHFLFDSVWRRIYSYFPMCRAWSWDQGRVWDHSVSCIGAGYMHVKLCNTCLSSSVLDSHWGGEPSFTF